MAYYRTMLMWKANDNIDFNFYNAHDLNYARDSSHEESIKRQLRERMQNAKHFILLVGESTRYLTKFVKWEVEYARKLDLPMIVSNLNGTRDYDASRCPSWVVDTETSTVHIAFGKDIIKHALDNFPDWYAVNKYKGSKLRYPASVYSGL
jgi:hypothetical protein